MGGFLGAKDVLTRERVKEIVREKQYSYFEPELTAPRSSGRLPIAQNLIPTGIQEPYDRDRGKGSDRGLALGLQN